MAALKNYTQHGAPRNKNYKIARLRKSYLDSEKEADTFRKILEEHVTRLLDAKGLRPIFKIESRTKEWPSIVTKVARLNKNWTDVKQIWDLIGIRAVFLFPQELERADKLLAQKFKLENRRPVGDDYLPNQFGYRSIHLTVKPRRKLLAELSLLQFIGWRAEIQIRTLAQHNWAAASRLLQYNQGAFAPIPVQRSLFRVAALIELVDSELEHVRRGRARYRTQVKLNSPDETLNVDFLERFLTKNLPANHRIMDDSYAELLSDLKKVRIERAGGLAKLINKHLKVSLEEDRLAFTQVTAGSEIYTANPILTARGVFYTQVGLVQNMLNLEYGTGWRKVRPSC